MNNWCFLFRILSSFLGPLPEPARAISHSWNQLKSAKLLGHTKLTDLLEQLKILLGGEGGNSPATWATIQVIQD